MRTKLLSFLFASPVTITLNLGQFTPQTLPMPRCSGSGFKHVVEDAVSHEPIRVPKNLSEVPSNPKHGTGDLLGQESTRGNSAPGLRPAADPRPLRALGANEDNSAAIRQTFPDQESELLIARLATHISFYSYLDQPVVNPHLVSLMPTGEPSFKRVYASRSFSESNRRSIDSFNRSLSELGSPQVETTTTLQQLDAALNTADGRPVVILGHSENDGAVLVLPSGERVAVVDIHEHCQRAHKACMVLTCDGSDFAVNGRLVATHALRMWRGAIAAAERDRRPLTVRGFRDEMIRVRATQRMREFITVSVVATGGGSGAVVVASVGSPAKR